MGLFNLRQLFLNCLKALHLCWVAVRNNQRVAFVGINADVMSNFNQQSIAQFLKQSAYVRQGLPRLATWLWLVNAKDPEPARVCTTGTTHPAAKLTARPRPSSRQPDRTKFSELIGLFNACPLGGNKNTGVGILGDHPNNRNRKDGHTARGAEAGAVLLLRSRSQSQTYGLQTRLHHATLQSKVTYASIRLSTWLYPGNVSAWFSNSEKLSKTFFNPCVQYQGDLGKPHTHTHSSENVCEGEALCEAFAHPSFALHSHTPGKSPRSPFDLKHFRIDLNKPTLQSPMDLYWHPPAAAVEYPNCLKLGGYLQPISDALFSVPRKPKHFGRSRSRPTLPERGTCGLENKRSLVLPVIKPPLQKRAKARFNALDQGFLADGNHTRSGGRVHFSEAVGLQSHRKHRQNIHPKSWCNSIQDNYVTSVFLNPKAYELLANNMHIDQAGLIFFVNPDKTPGLAAQAKQLRIPTVGLMGGLKADNQPESRKNIRVDYPIVGNPDHCFFVQMVMQMFISVINQARCLGTGRG